MDSLTQITLGAAVGEIVLGRKIGNRAMLWGGIAGTIPDLDVLANFFLNDVQAVAFHRGITHSLFFSVVAPFLFAWLLHRLYRKRKYRTTGYKAVVALLNLTVLGFILYGILNLTSTGTVGLLVKGVAILMTGYLVYRLIKHYFLKELESVDVSFNKWYFLFFWAFFTHILLDCFTGYGTQIFQPFSNFRMAFNNISVADPLYTFPFLACLIATSFVRREKKARRILNYVGLAISSLYMAWTISNKVKIDQVFLNALSERQIEYERCRTVPTIFNNLLWNCVAEGDSVYYVGSYSFFDSDPLLHHINLVPKRHDLIAHISETEEVEILKWFSEGYYSVYPMSDNEWILCDVRYGGITDTITSPDDYVFTFHITEEAGTIAVDERRERPDDFGKAFSDLFRRIKGYK